MEKSAEAFRTISEVADLLDTPAHVLRFWESRFPQIRPVKRAGGRRYYRPSDIALLTGIKRLLHDDGLTIRGVQKVLREQGIRHVSDLPPSTGRPRRPVVPQDDEALDEIPDQADVAGPVDDGGAMGDTATEPAPTPVVPLRTSPFPQTDHPAVMPPAAVASETQGGIATAEAAQPMPLPVAEGPAPAPAHPAEAEPVAPAAPNAPLPLWAAVDRPGPTRTLDAITPPADPAEEVWLPAHLRAMSPARAAQERADLRALHDRLSDLRDRVARAAEPALQ